MADRQPTRVFEALLARLATLVLAPALPVAWPGVAFTPPTSGSGYLRPTWLPAETSVFGVGDDDAEVYRGVLQVDVFWPEGRGYVEPLERAGAVAEHFTKGTKMDRQGVRVRVENSPSVEQPLDEPGWTHVPVTVPYAAYV